MVNPRTGSEYATIGFLFTCIVEDQDELTADSSELAEPAIYRSTAGILLAEPSLHMEHLRGNGPVGTRDLLGTGPVVTRDHLGTMDLHYPRLV